jgi:hypothetical protein
MRSYMFRNRWGALLFVGLTLAAVVQIVGTGKGDGAIDQARQHIAVDRAETQSFAIGGGRGVQPAVTTQFTPDEELIDPAAGEDPTPIEQRSEEAEAEAEADAEAAKQAEEAPHDTLIVLNDEAAKAEGAQ